MGTGTDAILFDHPTQRAGAEALVEVLVAHGVDTVFGVASVHNLPILDALGRRPQLRFVPCRHEQAAVHAADGYARAAGRLGVALTSTGPGAANSMGGLFEAAFASSPILEVTSQVDSTYRGKGQGFLHEAERQSEMLGTLVRRCAVVERRVDLPAVVSGVIAEIRRGRPQPAAVEIPIDLQSVRLVDPPLPLVCTPSAPPEGRLLDEAAELLSTARRPLLWAGGGVNTAGASRILTSLAECLQAPVLTSIDGRGAIPEDHALALGAFSDLAVMTPIIAAADVIMAVGTRFEQDNPTHRSLTIPGHLIHLDADSTIVGRVHPVAVALVGDLALSLEATLARVKRNSRPKLCAEQRTFVERARSARLTAETDTREAMGPDFVRVLEVMTKVLPRDAIVVKDATIAAFVWANRALPVFNERSSIRPASMAIGPALPLGIGAATATQRTTVVIHGDGGLMLSLGELATVVEQHLPLVLVVLNDGGYGVLRYMQDVGFGGRRTGVDLVTPDFTAVGLAMGMPSCRVGSASEFEPCFDAAVAAGGPFLVEVDLSGFVPMTIRPQRAAATSRVRGA